MQKLGSKTAIFEQPMYEMQNSNIDGGMPDGFLFFDNNAIAKEYDRLLEKGEIKSASQIDQEYIMFFKRFGPDVKKYRWRRIN